MYCITAFRAAWWAVNLLLAASLVCLAYAAAREWSVRQYLHGFSDAVVSASEPPEQKIEAILNWMRAGPSRTEAAKPDDLSPRNPENTLNYRQLLLVCGSATNAFLNLSRSAGLESRRLLLLTPDRQDETCRCRGIGRRTMDCGRSVVSYRDARRQRESAYAERSTRHPAAQGSDGLGLELSRRI